MTDKVMVCTSEAAELGGPYSQAVTHNGLIFLSGQGAVDPSTNRVRTGTIEEEARLAMENIRIIMAAAGASMSNLMQVTAYLVDIRDYGRFNDVYETFFLKDYPARTCVQVDKLPFGLRVEIDAVGFIDRG
ncbi:MAG: Rid family detoxifying hydrolase [Deltaproteobacteria bacterium]|nr:Rid family detoxifying hydrolase [Deltaproteobacteria bacterium]